MEPSAVDTNTSTIIVIIGLQALVSLVIGVIGIVVAFRRQPSIDQELVNYVRHPELVSCKAELTAQHALLVDRTEKTFSEAFNRVASLQTATEKTFSDVNRTLGRIEGKLENCPKVCS
jgi:hypothetical protein